MFEGSTVPLELLPLGSAGEGEFQRMIEVHWHPARFRPGHLQADS